MNTVGEIDIDAIARRALVAAGGPVRTLMQQHLDENEGPLSDTEIALIIGRAFVLHGEAAKAEKPEKVVAWGGKEVAEEEPRVSPIPLPGNTVSERIARGKHLRTRTGDLLRENPHLGAAEAYRMLGAERGTGVSFPGFSTGPFKKARQDVGLSGPRKGKAGEAAEKVSTALAGVMGVPVEARVQEGPHGDRRIAIAYHSPELGSFTAAPLADGRWRISMEATVERSVAINLQGQAFSLLFPRD